jgi:hypothetical protein
VAQKIEPPSPAGQVHHPEPGRPADQELLTWQDEHFGIDSLGKIVHERADQARPELSGVLLDIVTEIITTEETAKPDLRIDPNGTRRANSPFQTPVSAIRRQPV